MPKQPGCSRSYLSLSSEMFCLLVGQALPPAHSFYLSATVTNEYYAALATLGRNSSQLQKSGSSGFPTDARHGRVPVFPCSASVWPHLAQVIAIGVNTDISPYPIRCAALNNRYFALGSRCFCTLPSAFRGSFSTATN